MDKRSSLLISSGWNGPYSDKHFKRFFLKVNDRIPIHITLKSAPNIPIDN